MRFAPSTGARTKIVLPALALGVVSVLVVGVAFQDNFRQSSALTRAVERIDSVMPPGCAVTSEQFVSRLKDPFNQRHGDEPLNRVVATCDSSESAPTFDATLVTFEQKLTEAGYAKGPGDNERTFNNETVYILVQDNQRRILMDVTAE